MVRTAIDSELAGETIRCTAKRKLDHVACGDDVSIETAEHGNARLLEILPRHNALTRPDYSGRMRTMAANIDQIVVISAWKPQPFWELMDRYLVAASVLDTDVILLMNKNDLLSEQADKEPLQTLNEYHEVGYNVITAIATDSAAPDTGIQQLKALLDNKTSILVGQSGVGKSSIAQLLLPLQDIKVGEVSDSGEGKHTTTTTTLYDLPSGGHLIDSPGVRDFTLPEISKEDLRVGYREFAAYSAGCKFNNCTHQHEPGCQVRKALEQHKIPSRRYQRYLKLLSDIQ